MARIPNTEIERLKSDVSLLRLVERQGHQPKKQGKDYAICCPFHEGDDTPSLIISPHKNLFHCFSCEAGGTVIDWVMKVEGVSFRHAVELLQHEHSALAAEARPAKSTPVRTLEPLPLEQADQTLLNQILDFYHETLLQSPDALAYRLPEKQLKAGKLLRGQLQTIGLLRDSGHEHFNGSLIIPVLDAQGNVLEVYGRKIRDDLRKGTPKHLYLPGPHLGVFNLEGFADTKEIILCEALIDALTFYQARYTHVTASYGTGGFTDAHLQAIKDNHIERVLIAYDRDDAGNQAANELAKKLNKENIDCYRLHFPKGMDANQYVLDVQPASKSLGVVIRSAEWMGEGEPKHQPTTQAIEADLPNVKTESAEKKEVTSLDAEPSPSLPSSAVPPAPVNPVAPNVSDHEVNVEYGNRRYRVRGLQKNTSYEVLKVNVLVTVNDAIHVDTFDLYSAKHRQAFARVAAVECGIEDKIIQRDLGQLLLQLESLQDKAIQDALQPKEPTGYTMDETERTQALALLHDKQLAERIVNDFAKTGLVGEPTNALMGYLAAVSRKLKAPLAIIVQSTSAAGKSALMDAVLRLVPEEDRVQYSAMTGQSLFYLGETNLKHKILGIAEEEGVRQAAYALKLLQSEGELTIASTGKDPQTGKLITEEYRVEGPVMLFLTTTAIDIDEELLNRCVVLTINESREQTAAIQQRQRQARTLSGLLASNECEQLIKQHQNAQRLLRPLAVVNPYAEQLAFADSRTRTRRDHEKYLTLIDSIALLHQYQREVKTITNNGKAIDYIEVTLDDISLANQLAHDILGRSLDELPPPTRQLLQHLHSLVADKIKTEGLRQCEVRFTRREVREAAGLSDKQVRVHLERLVELEYVFVHHGKNGQRYVYELVFDGEPDKTERQLIGLIDVEQLKNKTTADHLVVSNDDLVSGSWPASDGVVATLAEGKNVANPSTDKGLDKNNNATDETHLLAVKKSSRSHRNVTSLAAEG